MANQIRKTIFFRKNKTLSSSGFTLVEILIVIAIIAFILSLGMPAIERITSYKLNSTTRKFVGLLRTIRNDSILLSSIHRLVIDIDKNAYWVESQNKAELLSLEPPEEEPDEDAPSNFQLSQKFSSDPIPLPDGVIFQGLFKETEGLRRDGVAYIHFFPNGYAEPSVLFLNRASENANPYALELLPPLGKVEIYREDIESFVR